MASCSNVSESDACGTIELAHAYLGGDDRGSDGPDCGRGGAGGGPQDAMGLHAEVGRQEIGLSVAAEGRELQA
jgi:hypothetical protein